MARRSSSMNTLAPATGSPRSEMTRPLRTASWAFALGAPASNSAAVTARPYHRSRRNWVMETLLVRAERGGKAPSLGSADNTPAAPPLPRPPRKGTRRPPPGARARPPPPPPPPAPAGLPPRPPPQHRQRQHWAVRPRRAEVGDVSAADPGGGVRHVDVGHQSGI